MIKISLSGNISTPDYLSRTLIKVSCDFLGWRSNRDCSTPLVIIKSIWSMQSYLSKQETLSASVSSCTSKTLIFSFVAMLIRECIINGLFSSAQDASRCKRRMGGSCGAALVPGSPACSQIRKRNSRPLSTLMPTWIGWYLGWPCIGVTWVKSSVAPRPPHAPPVLLKVDTQ